MNESRELIGMWWKGSYFKYITALILLLITIFFMKLMNMFDPFLTIFKTLFYPILIAGFLFYILRPVVEFISDKLHVPSGDCHYIYLGGWHPVRCRIFFSIYDKEGS